MKTYLTLVSIIISLTGFTQSWKIENIKIDHFNADTIKKGESFEVTAVIVNIGRATVSFERYSGESKLNALAGKSLNPGDTLVHSYLVETGDRYGPIGGYESIKADDDSYGYHFKWRAFSYDENAPIMKFDYMVLKRDSIEKNGDGRFDFPFTNTGKDTLIISNVKSSCGCLVPWYDRKPVQPGESGIIKSRYDTKRIGPINKSLTVTSNASSGPIVLRLKGSVLVPSERLNVGNEVGPKN